MRIKIIKMKKIISCIILIALAAALALPILAATPVTSLTGAATVRAGDTLTLTYRINGSGIKALNGTITYNTSQLTYTGGTGVLSDWEHTITDNKDGTLTFFNYEAMGKSAPINSSTAVFRVVFKVKSSLSTGTTVTVTAKTAEASDGSSDYNNLTTSYSIKISRPLSADASLSALSFSGYDLDKAFSSSIYEYSLAEEVPFSTTKLTVNATTSDSNAEAVISGATNLRVGKNTVTVTVTAEDGSTSKVYTVSFTRAQDPDYIASSEARLSSISPGQGILSPSFTPDNYKYIIYLPYECDSISLSSNALDALGTAPQPQTYPLQPGENVIVLTCTAEDGSTAEYTLTVMRMEEYLTDGQTGDNADTTEPQTDAETVETTETEAPETEETTTEQTDTQTEEETTAGEEIPPQTDADTVKNEENSGLQTQISLWVLLVAAAGALIVGVITGVIIKMK